MKCSIEALIEEITPVVTQKFDFEYRNESLLITNFVSWDHLDFEAENKLDKVSIHPFFGV